jgi:uncharacterized lipoprotein YmbA
MKTREWLILVALALRLLPGCSFLKARSDPTRYFVLTSAEPTAPVTAAPIVVGVEHIELPEYLMRPELVTRTAENQLAIAEYDRWGEPLKDGFSRTLRRDLENQLGTGHVIMAPFDPTNRPALTLELDVRRFERVGNVAAVLEARWTIRDGKSGAELATRDSRQRAPLAGADAKATVVALSQALAAFAAEVGTAIGEQAKRR